jgi:oligopeptide/dipeptide ABC transporter ATP-binding protein
MVPSAAAWPTGCRFADRCSYVTAQCRSEEPPIRIDGARQTRCWLEPGTLGPGAMVAQGMQS